MPIDIAKQKQNEKSEKLKNEFKDKIKTGADASSKDQRTNQNNRRNERHLADRKPVDLDKEIEMLEKKSRKRMRKESATSSDEDLH